MHETNTKRMTVSEIANDCGVSRSSILQRIKDLRKHRKTIDNFLYAKHRKNHKLYFNKFVGNLIENSFSYKKNKSSNVRNLSLTTKSQANHIKDLQTHIKDLQQNNLFLRSHLDYLIRFGK